MKIELIKLDYYPYYHSVIHINDYPFVIISANDDPRTSEMQLYSLNFYSLSESMQKFSEHLEKRKQTKNP